MATGAYRGSSSSTAATRDATLLKYLSLAKEWGGFTGEIGYMFTDFEKDTAASIRGFTQAGGSSGAITFPTTEDGVVAELDAGANAGSYYQLRGQAYFASSGQDRWIVIARQKISTTINATTFAGVGIMTSGVGHYLVIGSRGATSTTNFAIDNNGTGIDTGVAADTDFHVVSLASKADGKLYWRYDGGTEANAVASLPAGAITQFVDSENGGNAGPRKLGLDWALWCFGR